MLSIYQRASMYFYPCRSFSFLLSRRHVFFHLPRSYHWVSKSFASIPNTYVFNPLNHLAGVAPPFDPLDPLMDPAPPQGCNVTRAAYLVRHAAIYANDFDYESYIEPFVQSCRTLQSIGRKFLSSPSSRHGRILSQTRNKRC